LDKKIAIIGGGILGLAIGYELSISHPYFKVTLFEKEEALGKHQSLVIIAVYFIVDYITSPAL
jgi:L-2-hydroxyglutarate oxidase